MKKAVWFVALGFIFSLSMIAAEQPTSAPEGEVSSVEKVWPPGEVRDYLFKIAGQEVGRQWNQMMVGPPADSGRNYVLQFKLDLNLAAVGQPTEMKMTGELALTPEGRPLSYDLDVLVNDQKQRLTAVFAEGTVAATVLKGGGESKHSVPYSPDIFVVDNNMIGQWGLMLSLLPLKVGERIQQKIFVPQALTEMDIQVDVSGVEAVFVAGAEREAHVCHIAPIGETFWVTEDGMMLKLEDKKQSLTVTLLPAEGEAPSEEPSGDSFFLRTLPNRLAGYLIYLVVALAWLALLAGGRMRRWDLWLLLVAGGILFPLAISLQVPLQRWYARWVAMPGMQRGVSILILGMGTVALSGAVQELFKFLPIFLWLRLNLAAPDQRTAMALGAAVGAGFGLLEAVLVTGSALALGIVSPWAIFERVFAILFHTAVASIVAWGIRKRSSLRYFFLVALLHSLGNYSVVLFHQNLMSPVALELCVAVFDLCILAFVLLIRRGGERDLAVEQIRPQEVSHV